MNIDSGIYKIENIIDHKVYIGQSINLIERKRLHFLKLEKNTHRNRHLQNAYNKYGKENFIFNVILYCEHSDLTRYEQAVLDNNKSTYNICQECVDSSKGVVRSDEYRKKMSASKSGTNHNNYGKHLSDETKKKIRTSQIGKIISLETRKKISDAISGRTASIETRQKISISSMGRKHSDETKKKLSDMKIGMVGTMLGKHHTEETKNKMRKANSGKNSPMFGKHLPEETKQKIAETKRKNRTAAMAV